MIEHIMERIAIHTGNDPVSVRIINMNDDDRKAMEPMIEDLKKSADYENRLKEVIKFNKVRLKCIYFYTKNI